MPRSSWVPLPLDTKWFSNVNETALTRAFAALENAYCTEADGVSRFPGLATFLDVGGTAPVYLHDFRGDMIAVVGDGRVLRIDQTGVVENVTGVPVGGGRRVVFAKTDRSLLMAAGAQIIEFAGIETKVLSDDAPAASHVGFIDNYIVAGEIGSDRWYYSDPTDYSRWNPLDVFAASGTPDPITAMLVTPFREILFGGPDSVEQYERLPSGDPPFFRRWSVGEGILAPYTFCFGDNAAWGVNSDKEMVRFSGQISQPTSDDIGRTLEGIDDWNDAWAAHMLVSGQKFILLVIPYATNPYGASGLALAYDYRQQKWSSLYGWDEALSQPGRWPGWSYRDVWNRKFVGGEGTIYEFTEDTRWHAGAMARMLLRTAHLSELGETRIDQVRMRLRRGTGTYAGAGQISIRANRDNKGFGNWQRRSFGRAGEREMYVLFGAFGAAHSWQFEVQATDDTPVEIVKMEAQVTPLGF